MSKGRLRAYDNSAAWTRQSSRQVAKGRCGELDEGYRLVTRGDGETLRKASYHERFRTGMHAERSLQR